MNPSKSGYPHVEQLPPPPPYVPNQPPPQYTPNPVIMQPNAIPPPPSKDIKKYKKSKKKIKQSNIKRKSNNLRSEITVIWMLCLFLLLRSSNYACSSESNTRANASVGCLLQLSCKCSNTHSIRSKYANSSDCIDILHYWVRIIKHLLKSMDFIRVNLHCSFRFRLIPCAVFPYFCTNCQNCNHYCPSCNTFLGTYTS